MRPVPLHTNAKVVSFGPLFKILLVYHLLQLAPGAAIDETEIRADALLRDPSLARGHEVEAWKAALADRAVFYRG